MKKAIVFLTFSIVMMKSLTNHTLANEQHQCGDLESDHPMTIQEIYKALCFTDMDQAVKEFEETFNTKIALPEALPFNAAYKFGKIKDNEISLDFISQDGKRVFKLVLSKQNYFKEAQNVEYLTLSNGTHISLKSDTIKRSSIYWLSFKKDNYYYILSINKFNIDTLIYIAESLQ